MLVALAVPFTPTVIVALVDRPTVALLNAFAVIDTSRIPATTTSPELVSTQARGFP